jgi:hypothetical protein
MECHLHVLPALLQKSDPRVLTEKDAQFISHVVACLFSCYVPVSLESKGEEITGS